MMADLFVALMDLAVLIAPHDPATAFMWLTVLAVLLIEAVLALPIAAIMTWAERRDALDLATDWTDDPASLGEHIEVPLSGRKLQNALTSAFCEQSGRAR